MSEIEPAGAGAVIHSYNEVAAQQKLAITIINTDTGTTPVCWFLNWFCNAEHVFNTTYTGYTMYKYQFIFQKLIKHCID